MWGTATHAVTERSRPEFVFKSIEGADINLSMLQGHVILLVNTASKCGFTGQYEGLQELHAKYSDQGLVVIAIPSNDFRQELSDSEKIKDFCEVNFGITFPITEVTRVLGRKAHPFYVWLKNEFNFRPNWNFNKVILNKKGNVVRTFGTLVKPMSTKMVNTIENSLKRL